MADLLIRNIEPQLKREIAERARARRHSLSEEAKVLLRQALSGQGSQRKLGTELMNLVPPEYRNEDLVFERDDDPMREPPDFS
jgi:plasmid stability protein